MNLLSMLLLINKPTWYTSFDLIRKLKRIYPGEKIGHAGTLDPLATWLMIIAIGKDTKKIKHYVGLDKTYLATIDFSKKSDTWDTDYWEYYEELAIEDWKMKIEGHCEKWSMNDVAISWKTSYTYIDPPTQKEIEQKFDSIIGYHPLPLTPFSAKKRKGKKLYEYAREWNPVLIDIDMQLISYEIISYNFPVLQVRLQVGSGTYIRSIAHWLGEQLGVGGILTALHREKVGEWGL